MKKAWILLMGLLALAGLSGCPPTIKVDQTVNLPPSLTMPSASPSQDPEQKALVQVIHDNANALNGGDEGQFTASFHSDSEFSKSESLASFYQRLRNQYFTRYNIVETKIQSQSADIATVIVKRRTTDYTGTIEQDVLYTLRKQAGSWKIFSMYIQAARPVS